MKGLFPFLMTAIVLVGTLGCQQEANNTGSQTPKTTQAPAKNASQTSQTAKKTTATSKAPTGNITAAVNKHLQEKLPGSKLEAVDNKNGAVTVKGTVPSQADLKKVEPLTKEVQGVKTVKVEAKVAPVKKQ
ncbi:BON domain-containing protein [Chlorogloeopsis sp. ULAP01]|uniref:BON domain-containing protein n=1 Tax=Chlorogloeopsis sp. ULAP01 TaxID=3056483 RepID=UPI0025AA57A4|nr:BON domain-containing protein [Chlorogloeopsis sp. ULAP01]MDM9384816.1 BON domain-containing protein [Chlorogloeopsis sp. ULAP01]